jgi:hypothetical protein
LATALLDARGVVAAEGECASPAEDAQGVVAAEEECRPDRERNPNFVVALLRGTRSRGEPREVEAPSGVWKRICRRGWGRSSCVARAWARSSASSGTALHPTPSLSPLAALGVGDEEVRGKAATMARWRLVGEARSRGRVVVGGWGGGAQAVWGGGWEDLWHLPSAAGAGRTVHHLNCGRLHSTLKE